MREPATHAVVTHVFAVSRKIQPSAPNVVELLLRKSRSVGSSNARPANVVMNPSPCRPLSNSFCARYTPYPASGSISWPQRAPRLSCSVARSRAVTAVRPPTFQLPATLPVSFSAPRICAESWLVLRAVVERVAGGRACEGGAARRVWHDFQSPRRIDALDSHEIRKARYEASAIARRVRNVVELVFACDVAAEIDPPHVLALLDEAQL